MINPRPVALVTGASRGIGAAIARDLGSRGHHVVVNYRSNAEAAEATVRAIVDAGGTAQAIAADVRDADQVKVLVETVLSATGRIDALVCNANVQPPFADLQSLPWQVFLDKVGGELACAFHITQQVLPAMRDRGRGRIVYISSSVTGKAAPALLAHGTAKTALEALMRNVAADAGRAGITVNAVAPAAVDTEATTAVLSPAYREHLASRSVLGRVMEPDDIARVVGLVLDDGFAAVTGQIIRVDAGFEVLAPSAV
ncbi:SDR family oxidoreductase [Allokutzneria sp. A3M-2-11 16]|uniref:SDR family oxidoreductase n=1 Tax=Allokutzneria sp. A3M-2-11 16 TaxID=2962043 RepID=UPI0020B72FC0|nr:SDR family oxidoreductase [Allokutzneria sp. A3M-2-11 16]MCP3800750.1 SDR family oxidoreductase [Allokutzneria sp. A3M-2-11 16]